MFIFLLFNNSSFDFLATRLLPKPRASLARTQKEVTSARVTTPAPSKPLRNLPPTHHSPLRSCAAKTKRAIADIAHTLSSQAKNNKNLRTCSRTSPWRSSPKTREMMPRSNQCQASTATMSRRRTTGTTTEPPTGIKTPKKKKLLKIKQTT